MSLLKHAWCIRTQLNKPFDPAHSCLWLITPFPLNFCPQTSLVFQDHASNPPLTPHFNKMEMPIQEVWEFASTQPASGWCWCSWPMHHTSGSDMPVWICPHHLLDSPCLKSTSFLNPSQLVLKHAFSVVATAPPRGQKFVIGSSLLFLYTKHSDT